MEPPPEDPIIALLTTYNELNPASIDELHELPSPLEFMRYVSLNRPFVIRGGASDWEATRTWNVGTLKELLKGETVNVAITPKGNADAPTRTQDGELVFVKPLEEQQPFHEFIDFVAEQEKTSRVDGEVRYGQTQNDNLRTEYTTLFSHVSPSIPFARIALRQSPEAINFWLGNSHSVTALHKDNYENIYVQIIGQKHFVLLPPLAFPIVAEKVLKSAVYIRSENVRDSGDVKGPLKMKIEDGVDGVPFATWDPDAGLAGTGKNHKTKYEELARPVRVTLEQGDMLYLPALWYHKVSQSCSDEGICCAVNYWFDMDFGGSFYPLCNFVRDVALAGSRR